MPKEEQDASIWQISPTIGSGWGALAPNAGLYIHPNFFERGLVVIVEPPFGEDQFVPSFADDTFEIKSHGTSSGRGVVSAKNPRFAFKEVDHIAVPADPKERHAFFVTIGQDKQRKRLVEMYDSSVLAKTRQLLARFSSDESFSSGYIENQHRRGEIYIQALAGSAALYLQPWQSPVGSVPLTTHAELNKFSGFSFYHTVGCMFGTELYCRDGQGCERPYMKHDHEFKLGERITSVYIEGSASRDRLNCYEEIQFSEIESVASFMWKYSNPSTKAKVFHHLPYIDYILSGVSLFVQGRMTFKAFSSLCTEVLKKKEVHTARLAKIYNAAGLEYELVSPFENLIDFTSDIKAEHILKRLGLSQEDRPVPHDQESVDQSLVRDRDFARDCFKRLRQNDFNLEQKSVWFNVPDGYSLERIEDLLSLANATLIVLTKGMASKDNTAACSFVSVYEKQIQLEYCRVMKLIDSSPLTAEMQLITHLPRCIAYSRSTAGLPFYFKYQTSALSLVDPFGDDGLLYCANKNLVAHASGRPERALSFSASLGPPRPRTPSDAPSDDTNRTVPEAGPSLNSSEVPENSASQPANPTMVSKNSSGFMHRKVQIAGINKRCVIS